ncbi:hypothetical protein Cgig2_015502 [Carnegiea gigantea]|uniref:DUF4283 domain-containing protein n=1 Tax=Carnegiea gigantea TaxID=171969 RepID=A0A9Q1KG11_9CARY|nr:hypothetical protein Cgig2_015502 [Carnegiea gigantea]
MAPRERVVIKDLECNLFAFQFFSAADKDFVLNEGPWAFDGCILVLKDIDGSEQPLEVVFEIAGFWVKAYEIPAKQQTLVFVRFLASQVGTFVRCEESAMYGIDKSLCFRADINVSKPLRRVVKVKVEGKSVSTDIWRKGAETELREERRLFLAFRSSKGKTKDQTQLNFDTAETNGVGAEKLTQTCHSNTFANMAIDDMVEVTVGNEMFMRKLKGDDHAVTWQLLLVLKLSVLFSFA